MNIPNAARDQHAQRRNKLQQLRESGIAYRNGRVPDLSTLAFKSQFSSLTDVQLADVSRVQLCGRMMTRRRMGKASFAHLQDFETSI